MNNIKLAERIAILQRQVDNYNAIMDRFPDAEWHSSIVAGREEIITANSALPYCNDIEIRYSPIDYGVPHEVYAVPVVRDNNTIVETKYSVLIGNTVNTSILGFVVNENWREEAIKKGFPDKVISAIEHRIKQYDLPEYIVTIKEKSNE